MGDLDNDMDELFRKAANQYPLKTDGADWDKIMDKLPDAAGTPMPLAEPKKQASNKKLLWLVLLFPMGWLCNSYYNNKNNVNKDTVQTDNRTSTSNINKTLQVTDYEDNTVKKINNNEPNTLGVNEESILKQNTSTKTILDITRKETAEDFFSDLNKKNGTGVQSNPNKNFTDKDWKLLETEAANGLTVEKNKIDLSNGNDETSKSNTIKPIITNQSSTNNKTQTTDSIQTSAELSKDSFQTKNIDTSKKVAKKSTTKTSKGFYISGIGGLDASSVKSQGVKKVGFGFGLLVGYKLNKHIAFETGLLWDKKKYYTDGEYFNKTRTDIPSNYYISDINGNCNMFEVPIDFRYNFAQNKKGLLFATAGLSSYFMKKEAYDYEATAWGSTWPAMKTYNNSGSNLFSIVNLSVGLEHKISKSISVRINPYLKIPLKGLGIGSIPITSSGINIGITVPFHK